MLTQTLKIEKMPKSLKKLLSITAAGTQIVFTDGEKPVARLIAVKPRVPGLHPGAIQTNVDFDAPLPEEYWIGEG